MGDGRGLSCCWLLDIFGKVEFAAFIVATGWAEFLKRLQRLAIKGQRNHAAGWATFEELAQHSPRRETLAIFLRLGQVLPERERYQLAVAVTRLLAPIDLPQEIEAVRPRLADAVSRLSEEMDPDDDDSFFASIANQKGADRRRMAHLAMVSAEDLLRKPRRDQLRTIGLLCNVGMTECINAQRKYGRLSKSPQSNRFGTALADYVASADAMNDATGAVLFEGLHASLEEE